MLEAYVDRVHSGYVVLDIGQDIGALIIYTAQDLRGQQIDVSPKGRPWQRTHTDVLSRQLNGRAFSAAVFQALPADHYNIWRNGQDFSGTVSIGGGEIAEVDWQDLSDALVPAPGSAPNLLPPRYQNACALSAVPMGTAPLLYTDSGQVAWDRLWTDFCDLALAGGPPHRGSLLEPVTPDEVEADREGYERVVGEIERGLRLVTGLTSVQSARAGWVGLACSDEEMALWLLRAIVVENVCVRREGAVLFLPAGPDFTLEKEIKNIITAVAKTHHYWVEHCR
jgi:hypothetical protein